MPELLLLGQPQHQPHVLHRRPRRALAEIVEPRDQNRLTMLVAGKDVELELVGLVQRLGLDPEGVAAELGFSGSTANSIDGTASRDFVAEFAYVTAQIGIDDFMKIQLKAAKVLSAERVPKSEKLLKLQVSLGSEQRQIVAGIGKKYEPETLIGKTIVIVANLKPAKLMGIESQGMVLAAGDSEVRGLATFIEDVEPGTKVK